MSEITNDVDGDYQTETPAGQETIEGEKPSEATLALVKRITAKIKADKAHHDKAFKRMKRNMFVAFHGRDEEWSEKNYKANIAGRHVKQKTAALYAKNPKATAQREERLDFALWDEDPQSILMASQLVQQGMALMQGYEQQVAAATAQFSATPPIGELLTGAAPAAMDAPVDPMLPAPAPVLPLAQPPMPPGFDEAQALIADFTQGMQRREQIKKLGKTLEILFSKALREQKPVEFKVGMKQVVRRACTTGVGYVEIGFQRELGPRPGMQEKLSDAKARFDHLRVLSERLEEGEIEKADAEMAELEASIATLQAEPEIVIREGLIFDYPRSTKVIPDKLCKTLVGFVGARHVTIEYEYTCDEVQEIFSVDLKNYTGYSADGKSVANVAGDYFDEDGAYQDKQTDKGLVRVWKHYDKASGLVYYIADGHCEFLREPAAPDVFVEDFWPLYALTFNEVESEDELFPPSDVELLLDMQREHNRSRQGKREHREAARPRWAYAKGAIEEEDAEEIGKVKPFEAIGMNIDPAVKLEDVLQKFPVPGVDPNLYDTNEVMADAQIVVGAQAAQLSAVSKATATEAAIAEDSSASSDTSSVDDLDAFLTVIARSSGQILLKEMSEEKVKEIVGPGAFWPHQTLAEIASEVHLEVAAGSAGKPNQAVEVRNWKEMLPFLIQIGSIKPLWLAKETLRRLDDRMDLTEATAEDIPSIVAMNKNAQPGPEDPGAAPDAQGAEGVDKTSPPPDQGAGSGPAMGNNQV